MVYLSCQQVIYYTTYTTTKHRKGETLVIETVINGKEICQCRKCNLVFHQSQIRRVDTGLGVELQCPDPACGSKSFGLIDYPEKYESNITYKTEKFLKKKKKDSVHIASYSIQYNI